jgi:hypothetical protein
LQLCFSHATNARRSLHCATLVCEEENGCRCRAEPKWARQATAGPRQSAAETKFQLINIMVLYSAAPTSTRAAISFHGSRISGAFACREITGQVVTLGRYRGRSPRAAIHGDPWPALPEL